VRRATGETGLSDHIDEAVADVQRALEALRSAGLLSTMGIAAQIEYPVAGILHEGELAAGYADLVVATADRLIVLDFKTDGPFEGAVESVYPEYVAQTQAYGRLLTTAGVVGERQLQCWLLFTANGDIRWVERFTGTSPEPGAGR
jgi:ATP-dependent exoDNAse (exonuclease V) beta subunit